MGRSKDPVRNELRNDQECKNIVPEQDQGGILFLNKTGIDLIPSYERLNISPLLEN